MTSHDKNKVAVKAFVSTRSVERYLAGKAMRPALTRSIESALRALKLEEHLRRGEKAQSAPAEG